MKRGVAVIFNFIHFHKSGLSTRTSSVNDISKLKKLFYLMSMDVRVVNDTNLSQLMDEVEKLCNADFSDYEAIYLVFMSHGTFNNVVYCKDGEFNLRDACKGSTDVDNKYLTDSPTATQACEQHEIEDYVTLFSSFEGLISYLGKDGAPLIDIFCKVMTENFLSKTLLECLNMVVLQFNEQRDNQAATIHIESPMELKYYRIGKK